INTAADNAAGLAIATRMQLQINGYAQDVNNANNGVDFAQTAEGAMTGMTNNLQRIYELSNQAASYNTSSDRSDMNDEVQQLIAQLNSTVSQTEYNGSTFLNQNFSASFQTGNEVGQTISITTQNVAPNAFGVQSSQIDFTNTAANQQGISNAVGQMSIAIGSVAIGSSATINGVSLGAQILASVAINDSLQIITRLNQYTAQTNVTAFSFGNADIGTNALIATAVAGASGASPVQLGAGYLTINGIAIGSLQVAAGTGASDYVANLANTINLQTSNTGVVADVVTLGSNSAGMATQAFTVSLVNTSGAAITVSVATADITVATNAAAWTGDIFTNNSIAAGQNGEIIFSAPLNITSVTLGGLAGGSANLAAALGLASTATTISMNNSESINNINVTTVGNANLAILAVEQGINTLNNAQAYLGAVVNRFNSAVAELQSDSTNITSARSTFMDADY